MRDLLRFLNYIIQVPLSCDYAVNSFLMSLPHTLLNPTRTMYNTVSPDIPEALSSNSEF